MTKAEEEEIRHECAEIAYLESSYWSGIEDAKEPLNSICIGAVGACANIVAAILMSKSVEQVREEIASRKRANQTNEGS